MSNQFSQLSDEIFVHHGSINVGILCDGNRALLIDCGDDSVRSTLDALGISAVDMVLFTHHHRDQASGIGLVASDNTRIGVPSQERQWFESVETFWNDPQMRWHLYNYHPHNLMLAESVPVTDVYAEGESLQWGNAKIRVIDTPAHTDGSVSYMVEIDGICYAFCGDLIYDTGQIWELYSLQKGGETTDYHGFLGDRERLTHSLKKVQGQSPEVLIPHTEKLCVTRQTRLMRSCHDLMTATINTSPFPRSDTTSRSCLLRLKATRGTCPSVKARRCRNSCATTEQHG